MDRKGYFDNRKPEDRPAIGKGEIVLTVHRVGDHYLTTFEDDLEDPWIIEYTVKGIEVYRLLDPYLLSVTEGWVQMINLDAHLQHLTDSGWSAREYDKEKHNGWHFIHQLRKGLRIDPWLEKQPQSYTRFIANLEKAQVPASPKEDNSLLSVAAWGILALCGVLAVRVLLKR